MSTSNFESMKYDMPLVTGRTRNQIISDIMANEIREDNEITDDDFYFESLFDFEEAERLAEDFSENLKYHDIIIQSGYYDNFQFMVEERYSNYFDMDKESGYCIDNEDAHYYFDVCRSIALREADREKRKIRKWLESLVNYGFNIAVCTAVFGNGEAAYDIKTERTNLIAVAKA